MQKIDKTIIYVIFSLFATTYFLYLVNDILTPFVVALVFSYFLALEVKKAEVIDLDFLLKYVFDIVAGVKKIFGNKIKLFF